MYYMNMNQCLIFALSNDKIALIVHCEQFGQQVAVTRWKLSILIYYLGVIENQTVCQAGGYTLSSF